MVRGGGRFLMSEVPLYPLVTISHCRARRGQPAWCYRLSYSKWLKSRPESGLDCLICAIFARQRCVKLSMEVGSVLADSDTPGQPRRLMPSSSVPTCNYGVCGVKCMGTSLIRKRPPPRTTVGPQVEPYCRVLRGGVFL